MAKVVIEIKSVVFLGRMTGNGYKRGFGGKRMFMSFPEKNFFNLKISYKYTNFILYNLGTFFFNFFFNVYYF